MESAEDAKGSFYQVKHNLKTSLLVAIITYLGDN